MSSILKALKKLEQETAENAGISLTAGVKGRPINQPGKRPGSLVVPGLIAFILCIFAGVGILIYTQNAAITESSAVKKDENPVSAQKIPAEKIPAPKKAAAMDSRKQPRPAATAPVFEFATVGMSIPEKQVLDVKKDIQNPSSVQLSVITKEMLPEIQPEIELQASLPDFEYATADPFSSITPEQHVVNKNNVLTQKDPEPAVGFQTEVVADELTVPHLPGNRKYSFADKPAVKKTEPLVAAIEDTSVELQAISWSADPDKRLAIINGKICRENDHVGGYMIQTIKPDEVILTKGSVKGKLVFEIR